MRVCACMTVRQIVKSLNHLQVLSLLMDDGRKFSLLFDSAVRREHFAQAVQHLKHQHQPHDNIDHLSVFVGTWNMGNIHYSLGNIYWFSKNISYYKVEYSKCICIYTCLQAQTYTQVVCVALV